MNNFTFSGWLGKNPEIKYFDSGAVLVEFSVALQEYKKDKDKESNWIDVKCWQKTAEFAGEFLKKGDFVICRGRIEQERWNDKDGNKRSKIVVTVEQIDTPPKPKDGAQSQGNYQQQTQPRYQQPPQSQLDDTPF